jgi:hypothetical protein
VYSGGQTGPVGLDGEIVEERVPDFARRAPVRVGYLTAIDPKTRDSNWTASHQWGVLPTGLDGAGVRPVNKLRKETK